MNKKDKELFLQYVEDYAENNETAMFITWLKINYILNSFFPDFLDKYWLGTLKDGTGKFKPAMRQKVRQLLKDAGWKERKDLKAFKKFKDI